MAVPKDWMKMAGKAGWDILSATLGDILAKLKEDDGPTFFAERIKQSIAKGRDDLGDFLIGDLLDGTTEGEAASAALLEHQRLWQKGLPRRYGTGEPYKAGTENSKVDGLTKLYQVFNPPERLPFPDLRTGRGADQVNAEILREYRRQQGARDRTARRQREARIACFKRIGQMSFEERDAFLELVNDDTLAQFIKRAVSETRRPFKAGWKKLDEGTGKAAPHVGRLADWINAQP